LARTRDAGVGPDPLAPRAYVQAVKTFYAGLCCARTGFDATPVLSTRAPKFTNRYRARSPPDAGKSVIEVVDPSRQTWIAARRLWRSSRLLYGCGLRNNFEALGLPRKSAPLARRFLRIRGKA